MLVYNRGCGCANCWERGWAEGFWSRHTVDGFLCLAGQADREVGWWERKRGSASSCTSKDDLGDLKMKAEKHFRRTWRVGDKTCQSNVTVMTSGLGHVKVFFHSSIRCKIRLAKRKWQIIVVTNYKNITLLHTLFLTMICCSMSGNVIPKRMHLTDLSSHLDNDIFKCW